MPTRFGQRGLSLVEGLMSLVITTVALGLTVPSMTAWRERAAVASVASLIETDLQLARTTAITLNRVVHFSVSGTAAGTCYVIHTGSPNDCTCTASGTPHCVGEAQVVRSEFLATTPGPQLRANVRSLGFEPLRGMVTPTATFNVVASGGSQMNLVINIMGRVRACSPTSGGIMAVAC
ncbi:MAG: hypothetical protein RLZZ598_717 [Pseudomonadota bacterium]|jgi:type IV fimbrial biogenesis protein FimT